MAMSGFNCTEARLYHNLFDAVSVCLRQYDPVRYARRGAIPSQYFMGREYPWNEKEGTYGRWVTGRGGAKYFIKLEDAVQRELNRRKPSDEDIKKQLRHLTGADSVTRFQALTKEEQERALSKLKAKGVTIKQLQAATGLSYYAIQKA